MSVTLVHLTLSSFSSFDFFLSAFCKCAEGSVWNCVSLCFSWGTEGGGEARVPFPMAFGFCMCVCGFGFDFLFLFFFVLVSFLFLKKKFML